MEGTVFPSHTVHTHRLALRRCVQRIHIGLISMLTYSPTAETTAGSVWERPAVGLDMKPDGSKKKKRLPGAAEHYWVAVQ